MLFGKPKMDEEERKQRSAEIENLMNQGKSKEAYAKTLELEKLDKDAAGRFMSQFYFLGENVKEDEKEAIKRIERYVRRVPDDPEGWLLCGQYLMAAGRIEEATPNFEKAAKMENNEAAAYLAGCYKAMADQFRNQAAGTLNVKEYTNNNNQAISLYVRAMSQYDKLAREHGEELDDTSWQSYGRAAEMMYSLSLTGEVKKVSASDPASQDYLNMGLSVISGKANTTEQRFWRLNAIRVYGQMERAGYQTMAEYFRTSMCLADVSEKKDQPMFTNARWHMDRALECSVKLDADQRKSYPEDFADVTELYGKMDKKYGKVLQNRLRAGEYPNLAADYEAGQAPAMEACQRFMAFVNTLGSEPAGGAALAGKEPEKKKKGLFGLFR